MTLTGWFRRLLFHLRYRFVSHSAIIGWLRNGSPMFSVAGGARFFRRGVTKVKFVPAIAVPAAPTAAELTAGTELTTDVAEVNGFALSNDPIPTPDLNSVFTSTIGGEDTTDASSLVFYDQDNVATIRTALAKGTTGYIVFAPYGYVATKRLEVWPIKSTGVNDQIVASNDPARFTVGFAITATPTQNAVHP